MGGGALAEGIADEEVESGAMLGVALLFAGPAGRPEHIPVAGGAGGATKLFQGGRDFAM